MYTSLDSHVHPESPPMSVGTTALAALEFDPIRNDLRFQRLVEQAKARLHASGP
jgi:hypothetical protein